MHYFSIFKCNYKRPLGAPSFNHTMWGAFSGVQGAFSASSQLEPISEEEDEEGGEEVTEQEEK